MAVLVSHRSLFEPKSLADALKMLRDEGPLVPMAGCTDLYVSLNFGTLADTRFLNLWRLEALRSIEVRGAVLAIGALATHTDLIRSPLVRARIPMLAPTPRLALGSVAPTVVRAPQTEAALAGGASLEDAQRTLAAEIAPIDDIRSTAEYRRRVASNLLARFWADTHRG